MNLLGKRFARPGTAPGTLTPPEVWRTQEITLTVVSYDTESLEERADATPEEAFALLAPEGPVPADRVTWVNVVGLHDVGLLQRFGEGLGLHPLTLEDVLNVGQRPKLEEHGDHLFTVLRLFHLAETLESEQISLFLGPGWVLTWQEIPADVFDPVRERLRLGKGRIRSGGASYLFYALGDAIVDSLFPLMERYGERIEGLEDRLLEDPRPEVLESVHEVKKDLLSLRRAAWPQREVFNALTRLESALVSRENRIFLRDVYDHSVQILDILETYRDLATGLMDLYLSSVSNRMNEVMKVLTVIATLFIPLTFLAGIYGMNFDPEASPWNMPELGAYWGYPVFWGVSLLMTGGLLLLFRRKGWL